MLAGLVEDDEPCGGTSTNNGNEGLAIMSLTYKVPEPPGRPFRKGDIVETLDRNGGVMGTEVVVYAGPKIVRTKDGRRWNQDGWWVGEIAWPFPSIRLKGSAGN